MRIAYICADPGIPVFGCKGCSIHVTEVLRALVRRGAAVELFACRFDGQVPPGLESVRIHRLPQRPKGDTEQRERALLAGNALLGGMLQRQGSYDLVYERYSLWSYAAMEYARSAAVPGLLEVNAPLVEEQARHRHLVDRPGAERVRARVFQAATAILAVSDPLAAQLRSAQPGARLYVVPNGVNPDSFSAAVAPALPPAAGTFTIGFVGSLKPWHGLATLVEAFADLARRDPAWRLLLVGDGPERAALESQLVMAAPGMARRVHFAGAVRHDEIPAYLASMDVAVAPYPDLPGFYFSPLKLFEYMAAGLPVVASRVGQIGEVIEDGGNGLLCRPDSARELAAVLERLRQDEPLRRRLGQAARRAVRTGHTWNAVVRRILKIARIDPARSPREVPA